MVATLGKPVSRARPLFGLVLALLWVFAVGPFTDASAQTSQEKWRAKRANSPFNLASGPSTVLEANLVQCGIDNFGNVCSNVFDSPTGGGGYWPAGTTNAFIFNSGLQIAGIYGAGAPTSGVFAVGDTVGAYFFDARGTQEHGAPLTDVYNSLIPADVANWPEAAIITDTALFNPALVGSKAISDQDSYVEYWDGDPNKISQRSHPMGIKVSQRSLSFNSPSGAEHTIFFIYKFTNVTNDPAFQSAQESRFGQQLPDAGWTIGNIYAAFAMDPDVTSHAGNNFSTAILPLNMGIAYHAEFSTDDFDYGARADLYAPPFFQGPGFVGVKYLRSPINPATGEQVGLTMFSNTTNGPPFPDPVGVKQLFRYLKGDLSAASGDQACTVADPMQRRLCAAVQQQADTRFFEASGPFSLAAGQSGTIVVAYTHGAPVAIPGYAIGDEVRPGIPSNTPGVGADTLRLVERIAGMIQIPEAAVIRDEAGAAVGVDQTKLVAGRDFVRRSIIHNALIAQDIFNTKFLLPRPPEAPVFSLVPGDGQVTIVWAPSATDVNCVEGLDGRGGDPYYTIAADPTSPQSNPNYRRCDVEGYKIYRSTGLSGGFEEIAQFHKVGNEWIDLTCELDPTFVPGEEGADCQPRAIALTGEIVQYRAGGRVRDTGGNVQVISSIPPAADTVTLDPADEGIPFAYVDNGLRNGITYRYIVTAFDINSVASGATSLESARIPQFVTPRKDPNNFVYATFTSSTTTATGAPLPTIPYPTVNGATGIFSGPMPPTNGLNATFSPVVERLLPAFKLKATIDSILPFTESTHPQGCPKGSSAFGGCWRSFMTFDRDGVKTQSFSDGYTPLGSVFAAEETEVVHPLGSTSVPPDPTAAAQFGLPASFPGFVANVVGTFPWSIVHSQSEGWTNRMAVFNSMQIYPGFATGPRFVPAGSRWFSGANETEPDPTRLIRVGTLTGVDSVWAPIHHTATAPGAATANLYPGSVQMQCWSRWVPMIGRAADVRFTWAAGGTVNVQDMSHGTPVIFKPTAQASYGFLNTDANGNGVIDWADFNYIENVSGGMQDIDGGGANGFCGHVDNPAQRIQLEAAPEINDVSIKGNCARANGFCGNTDLAATGRGFGLYVNGERFIFQLTGGNLPGAGQTWTLRTYSGLLRCASDPISLDPGGCSYWANFAEADVPLVRQPMVTGIAFNAVSTSATGPVGEIDMSTIHTVPDPYYVRSAFELGPSNKVLRFVNVPSQAIIRIYSLNGTLVRVIEHNDVQGGAEATWDLRNRNNQFVASGVYFYVVEASNGEKFTGKFTVVQFAR